MSWLILTGLAVTAAIAYYLFRPHPVSKPDDAPGDRARRERLAKRLVRTPEDMAEMGDVRGLTLKVPDVTKACSAALKKHGETFVTFDAAPLPLPDCGRNDCECSYYAIPGRRSGRDRRDGIERRDSVRFDPDRPDRRSSKDRRRGGSDPWKGRA